MNRLVASSAAQVLFVFLFAPTLSNLGFAQAQTLTTLYNFQGPPADGMSSGAGILRDQDGNMYGTTSAGGQAENGTAFEVDASATETMLQASTSWWTASILPHLYPLAPEAHYTARLPSADLTTHTEPCFASATTT